MKTTESKSSTHILLPKTPANFPDPQSHPANPLPQHNNPTSATPSPIPPPPQSFSNTHKPKNSASHLSANSATTTLIINPNPKKTYRTKSAPTNNNKTNYNPLAHPYPANSSKLRPSADSTSKWNCDKRTKSGTRNHKMANSESQGYPAVGCLSNFAMTPRVKGRISQCCRWGAIRGWEGQGMAMSLIVPGSLMTRRRNISRRRIMGRGKRKSDQSKWGNKNKKGRIT